MADVADVADAADAAAPPAVLYAHIRGKLWRIDPDTAAMTMLGATGQTDLRLAWDGVRGELRGIVDALTAPKMVTVDRCNGTTVVGPRIVKSLDGGDGGPLKRVECFAAQPGSGAFYGSGDWDNSVATTSEALVHIDSDAGAAARTGGNINTLQDDSDTCAFRGQELYFLDVMATTPATGSTGMYVWNLADAGTTLVGITSPKFTRMGYEINRDAFFGFDSVTRELVRIRVDGGSSVVGSLALVADAAQSDMDSLVGAPLASCP